MKLEIGRRVYVILFIVVSSVFNGILASNLTCYQCKRTTNTECSPSDLLPCPPSSDKCVTHITKSVESGFSIKRECGMGPCSFEDPMVSKGLGMDNCDRSKSEYFCVFCCGESGCNRSGSKKMIPSKYLIITTVLFVCLLYITGDFITPYFASKKYNN